MSRIADRLRTAALWVTWRLDFVIPGLPIPIAHHLIDADYEKARDERDNAVARAAVELSGWPEGLAECKNMYEEELALRETIERKAMSLVSAMGIGAGLITGAGLVGVAAPEQISDDGKIAIGAALVPPLICFLAAFLAAVTSWRVGRVELVGADSLRHVLLQPADQRSLRIAAERIVATKLNQMLTLKRINYLNTAERWVLRGTIALSIAAIALLFVAVQTDLFSQTATDAGMP